MWKFRHWLMGKFLMAALVTMPESAAKDLLAKYLADWGRLVSKALAQRQGERS